MSEISDGYETNTYNIRKEVLKMKRNFELFNYKNLGSVRVQLDEQGNPWFCLNDVCGILGIASPWNITSRLDEKGICSTEVLTNGGNQKMTFIDEGNLYEAIGRSRKPEAKAFMNWVYREVLPSIRKTGSYNLPSMTVNEILHSITGTLVEHDKKFNAYDKRFNTVGEKISTLENGYENHNNEIVVMKTNISDIRRIQEEFIKSGYLSVRGFCILANLKLPVSETSKIGKKATNICKLNNIRMGTEPDDHFGYVNTYPYSVLAEIFDEYVKN